MQSLMNTLYQARLRGLVYGVTTLIIALELAAGGVWDILPVPYVRDLVVDQLGYPAYFLFIIGVLKVPAAVVLLLPRLPRLKEWAYAGAFFTYAGAAASHVAVGDSVTAIGPIILAVIMVVSWATRPAERRNLSGVLLRGAPWSAREIAG
jgi:hypothetical protein